MSAMRKSVLGAAVAAALGLGSMGAHAAVVSSISITGGDFGMNKASSLSGCGAATSSSSFQCITPGGAPTVVQGQGAGVSVTTATGFSPSITAFNFFGSPVTTGLAANATGAANAFGSFGTNGFQGSTSGSTIQLDLGGWYANWNGTNFLQGTDSTGTAYNTSQYATGTCTTIDATHCSFDITWHSYITTAPFAGKTGYWELTGTATTASVVPLPAAVWLLGSGLVGLVGVARRRKNV